MTRRISRRAFLQTSAAAGLGYWALGGLSRAADSDKINIACIGVGGKGDGDSSQAGKHGNVVAICDIDDNILAKKAAEFPQAKKYNDFRKMLDELGKQIDAVTISTPDHTHAVAAMMALKMKKHVYCQKPLTHSPYEARKLRETAAELKLCTQMGNQGTAGTSLRRAAEIVQAGGLGKVTEVYVWTNRPVWPQAPAITKRPDKSDPVPETVHWDLWLGPAPERPFVKDVYHTFKWRGWWDFGTGAIGDMACHTVNLPFLALKLGYPTNIVAENDELNSETYPGWAKVTFEFPARGEMPPVKLVWHEGRKDGVLVQPPQDLLARVLKQGEKLSGSGSILVGDRGLLYSKDDYGQDNRYLPGEIFTDSKAPETLPRNNAGDDGMKAEWVSAIKQNKPEVAVSNFNYGALLTETILLGNVAMRAGKKLDWDGEKFKFTNDAAANKFLHDDYRKGWTL